MVPSKTIRFLTAVLIFVYIPTCMYIMVHIEWDMQSFVVFEMLATTSTPRKNPKRQMPISLQDLSNLAVFQTLFSNNQVFCNGQVSVHGRKSVLLKNVRIVPAKAFAKARGGEELKDVMNRKETEEFYAYKKGFFQMDCDLNSTMRPLEALRRESQHFKLWVKAVEFQGQNQTTKFNETVETVYDFTIAVTRYEYTNVYWMIMEIYNVFLSAQFYRIPPNKINVLLFDAHSKGSLDPLWTGLFKSVKQLRELSRPTTYSNLAWNFPRSYSPLLVKKLKTPMYPLLTEFREFVIDSLKINKVPNRNLHCQDHNLNVLFVWRHDILAHSRNPTGVVSRKISNEQELLNATRAAFPNFIIRGEQLDSHDIVTQLTLVSSTDIFIGMHGAAFGFIPFISPGGAVVELWPKFVVDNWHMEALAVQNHLHYNSWKNNNTEYENKIIKSTYIPPDVVVKLIRKAANDICTAAVYLLNKP